MQYLSDEWINAAAQAVADAAPEVEDGPTSLQFEVTAAPGGKVKYALVVEDGTLKFVPGTVKDAEVSFTLDYTTAAEIARGDLPPQVAFMQGRLKLGGDVTVMIRQAAALAGLDDALAELRATTTY